MSDWSTEHSQPMDGMVHLALDNRFEVVTCVIRQENGEAYTWRTDVVGFATIVEEGGTSIEAVAMEADGSLVRLYFWCPSNGAYEVVRRGEEPSEDLEKLARMRTKDLEERNV